MSKISNVVSAFNRFTEKYILYLFLLFLGIGLALGSRLDFISRDSIGPLLFIVSFASTLKMTASDFNRSIKPKLIVLMILFTQFIFPIIVWLFCKVFYSENGVLNDFGLGLIFMYCIPCAISLAIWVLLADGDAGISFAFVLIDNALGFLLTPLLMAILCSADVEIDFLGIMKILLFQVVIPSILGIVVSTVSKNKTEEGHQDYVDKVYPYVKAFSKICLFLSVCISVSKTSERFFETISLSYLGVGISCAFLNFFNFVLSTIFFLVFKKRIEIDRKQLVAATYGCSMKNCGTSVILSSMFLPPLAVIPCILDLIEINVVAILYTKLFDRIIKKQI